jgi:hypothetical protein
MSHKFELALPDLPDQSAAVVIARLAEPRMCPVLGPHVQQAVSRVVAGMPVVLVHRGADGDLRMYGAAGFESALIGLDLDAQPWVVFELPAKEPVPAPSIALAA